MSGHRTTCVGVTAHGDCDKPSLYVVATSGGIRSLRGTCGLHLAQEIKRHLASGPVTVWRVGGPR